MNIETLYWYALTFHSGLGAADVHYLARFWCEEKKRPLEELFRLNRRAWKAAGFDDQQTEALARAGNAIPRALRELEPCRIARMAVFPARHPGYPKRLADAMGRVAPPLLFCAGNPEILLLPSVSLIGPRDTAPSELALTRETAASLARAGIAMVAGCEAGAERCALLAALETGGKALLVLDHGLLHVGYTPDHLGAYVHQGQLLVVSPCEPRSEPLPAHAAQRDALITALSEETIICQTTGERIREAATIALRQKKRVWLIQEDRSSPECAALFEKGAQPAPASRKEYPAWLQTLAQRALNARKITPEKNRATTQAAPSPLFPEIAICAAQENPDAPLRQSTPPRLPEDLRKDILEFAAGGSEPEHPPDLP